MRFLYAEGTNAGFFLSSGDPQEEDRDEISPPEVSLPPWGLSDQLMVEWFLMSLQIIQRAIGNHMVWAFAYSDMFQSSLYSKYTTSRWQGRRICSPSWDDHFCMNMPLHFLGWLWALLPALGEGGPGRLLCLQPCHACSIFLLFLFLTGQLLSTADPLLPFPSHVLMTPMMRRKRILDALLISKKHVSFQCRESCSHCLIRNASTKTLFLGSYLLQYLSPFNIALPLPCYQRRISTQHISVYVDFYTQAFDVT